MPKLKHLELQGYKTFAARTEFLFDEGITAIIGPNGSGKSNIADGMRWVLGEQSFRTLRGRQTEDMIFHGSDQRARLGMASVSMTLDNTSGWLPVEFQEVAIARRAYRSGENEYLLNNTRVRLRDVLEVLGATGLGQRTYTVIGQGLVDTALSLRPEERRSLFEEAAGIMAYKDKRQEAINRLEETQVNLTRVHDIIAEITPRLKRLEAQAQKADELQHIQAELRSQLSVWHAFRWHRALQNLQEERQATDAARLVVQTKRGEATKADSEMVGLQQRQGVLRGEVSDWHRRSGELHRQSESLQRELAVRQERRLQISQRLVDLESELDSLQTRRADLEERVSASQAQLEQMQAARQAQLDSVTAAQSEYSKMEAELRQRQRQVEAMNEDVLSLVGHQAEQSQRQRQLKSQQAQLHTVHSAHERDRAEALAEAERLRSQLSSLQSAIAATQQKVATLEAAAARQRQEMADCDRREREAADAVAGAQHRQTLLQDRLDLLSRLEQEGEGRGGALGKLLAAQPKGIVGTVAKELRVPARLERAVEAALGSRLHDVLVESRSDAELAISWLKRERAGRARFLPLDSLRPAPQTAWQQQPGVIGLASELVEADARLRPVVTLLLGRCLIIEDLDSARRLFDESDASPLWQQAVTLEGDILYADGRVAGGSDSDGGVLSRERQRRELPLQLQEAVEATKAAQVALSEVRRDRETLQKALAKTLDDLKRQTQSLKDRLAQLPGLQRPLDLADQKAVWYKELLVQTDASLQAASQSERALTIEAEDVRARLAEKRATLVEARKSLAAIDTSSLQAQLLAAKADLARFESQRDGLAAVLAGQQEAQSQVVGQIAAKQSQRQQLAAQLATLESEIASRAQQAADLAQRLQALASRIGPAESELHQIGAQQAALERNLRALQARLREEELRSSKLQLNVERRQDELLTLHREIETDLGPVRLEASETLSFLQPLLPLGMPADALPPAFELPEGIEGDITRLRRQERRMGTVNPEAPAEYREALERHRFLSEQADDLERASKSLREVIAELDTVMKQEFERTFEAVKEQFSRYFVTLFGGGSARLELTNGEDPTQAGVEIAARPPGKRVQGLAQLSGGERSLTAIALIFAILKVSPPPFCVLDEVDAMLDEANVARFRSLLKELSANTQFVVITHNRGTIEAADTIYGVSMGPDSVSQVVSLRLHGERVAD